MAAEVSLFSRVRPGNPGNPGQPAQMKGFLALPGEIRNRIYYFYHADNYRCEIAAKGYRFDQPTPGRAAREMSNGSRKTPGLLPEYPNTIRVSRQLGRRDVNQGLSTIWTSSLCPLIFVCKQIHAETIKDFYKRVTFAFNSPRRVESLLDTASALCLQNITKMHLHYTVYGEPMYTKDCPFLEKHRRSWKWACTAVTKKLTGLQDLEIWVYNSHPAPKFNLGVDWIKPLIQFRMLTTSPERKDNEWHYNKRLANPALKTVNVHVDTNTLALFNPQNSILTGAATELHRLFGLAISLAILGYTAEEAMKEFDAAWYGKYRLWQYHLGYGSIRW